MRAPRHNANALRLGIAAPSAHTLGGVQTWLDYLLPGLEESGWSVSLYLPEGPRSDSQRYLAAHALERYARPVENPTGSREGRVRSLMRAIVKDEPDVVLNVNIADTYEALRRLRAKGHRSRCAIGLHGLTASYFAELAEWTALVDGVVATNRLGTVAARLLGRVAANRCHYAPCGVEMGELPLQMHDALPLELLYVGRFDDAEKRVLDLPPICAALRAGGVEFRLRLAGSGPDEAALRVALQPFGEAVKFLGQLQPEELWSQCYRAGAILLVTSGSETGPLAVWEAFSAGVAVVTSSFLGIGQENALVDGRNCLVYPVGDALAGARCIEALAHVGLRAALVREGWKTARERYSRESSVRAWDTALKAVATGPSTEDTVTAKPSHPSGRLDHLLGTGAAETARKWLGLRFEHSSAGGEWPHCYAAESQPAMERRLRELDAGDGAG